jgi:protein-serine/threonine kinase
VLHDRTDSRSDIFSLGVVLYHLATGVRPFGFPDSHRGLRRRLWRDPVPPRALNCDIPPSLQEVILHCLEPDADARYPNAEQVAFDLKNLETVKLGARAARLRRDGPLTVFKRRLGWIGKAHTLREPRSASLIAPIVMAAIDLSDGMEALAASLRETAGRVLTTYPQARLACVNVLKQNRVGMNNPLDAEGRNIHVQRLIELKDWARPLGLDNDRITFHVLEHPDEAQALIEYASGNCVDHILIGALDGGGLRRRLGDIPAQIVAEAPCTVTIVRQTRIHVKDAG